MFQAVAEDSFGDLDDLSTRPAPPGPLQSRSQCLAQLLSAFHDLADRDDIHQASRRLALVQDWIAAEQRAAAADPIFAA